MSVFSDKIKESLIFHIPHSSTHIPFYAGFNLDLLKSEMIKLTDWATDEIFNIVDADMLITPFSRLFCDVERLPDNQESMFDVGRGFFYTHTDEGEILREEVGDIKTFVLDYYNIHHKQLTDLTQSKLDNLNQVNIIDCHSFTDKPFNTDLDKSTRPDICIGTDEFHTPKFLIDLVKLGFENAGYTVKINSPYIGTIVPLKFYNKEKRVNSIMIEINRNLYMENNKPIKEKVLKLNTIINNIFDF